MYSKKFFRFVMPSILAFALSGIYSIVDGYFVGNNVGDAGMTAINVVFPVVSILQALGTGIGMGGSIQYSILKAAGKEENALKYLRATITCLLISSILMPLIVLPLMTPILKILGATGIIAEYGRSYLSVVILGSFCQIFGTGMTPLVRNNGGASFSMFTMISGFITNVILDYTFVWVLGKGVAGAALATVTGQFITAVIGTCYLLWKKIPIYRLHFKPTMFLRIFKNGISAFGITLCPNITLLLMNLFLLKYGGESSVACYAVISYATYFVYLILQGVGDGCQPLLSDYFGRGDMTALHKTKHLAYITAEIIAALSFVLLYVLRYHTGNLFGASETVTRMVGDNMPILLVGFLFLAYARVSTSSFYATQEAVKSSVIVYSEIIFFFLLLIIFPRFFGEPAVWWSMSIAQILAMILSAILNIKHKSVS